MTVLMDADLELRKKRSRTIQAFNRDKRRLDVIFEKIRNYNEADRSSNYAHRVAKRNNQDAHKTSQADRSATIESFKRSSIYFNIVLGKIRDYKYPSLVELRGSRHPYDQKTWDTPHEFAHLRHRPIKYTAKNPSDSITVCVRKIGGVTVVY